MPTKVNVSINTACHENWQYMNSSKKGRFCNACAKEVVDFTEMDDLSVLNYFNSNKKENVCGRFYADQLNRDIKKPVYPQREQRWYWNFFMLLLLLFKGNTGKAQVTKEPVIKALVNPNYERTLTGRVGMVSVAKEKQVKISGKVVDGAGGPIAFATILVKGTKNATHADVNGLFKIDAVSNNVTVMISAVGYKSAEFKVNGAANVIVLRQIAMGDVVVTGLLIVNDDYTPPVVPTHVAVIEVKDDADSLPINASIKIKNDYMDDIDSASTNKKGIYKLRGIREKERYTITISAVGYQDKILEIDGYQFSERKEKRYVFLKKVVQPERRILIGGAYSEKNREPLYIIDGVVASSKKLMRLKPHEIESVNVLKDAAAIAIHGSRATNGVIIITTKKKTVAANKLVPLPDADSKKTPVTAVNSVMKIVPNPVQEGGALRVSFTSKAKSEVTVQVANMAGKILQSQKLVVTGATASIALRANTNWSAGMYFVTIVDASGNLENTSAFVLQ